MPVILVQSTNHSHLFRVHGDFFGFDVNGYGGYYAKGPRDQKEEWREVRAWFVDGGNNKKYEVNLNLPGNTPFTAEEIENAFVKEFNQ